MSSVDPTKAVGEHDRAASQYATAAKDTSNSEVVVAEGFGYVLGSRHLGFPHVEASRRIS